MLTHSGGVFEWRGAYDQRGLPRQAGFTWRKPGGPWYTASPYVAYGLRRYADNTAAGVLRPIHDNIVASRQCGQNGRVMYPFQWAGVEHMSAQFAKGRKAVLCADEQGLGKTIQAIGVANELGYEKLLIICPASLRLNWEAELRKWHIFSPGINPIFNSKTPIRMGKTNIVSYHLVNTAKAFKPDFIIVDEAHYLKNAEALRTKLVLGAGGVPGLVRKAPTIFLTGTPTPNGRPNELWPILIKCAPTAINYMEHWPFLRRFCIFDSDEYGFTVTGAKNMPELNARLRGSGFMTRRLKADVLKDLPPKRFKMVVFPLNSETRKVVKKEAPFNAAEIIAHGVPVGSALPEVRQEMGLAKAPQCIKYIRDMLESGTRRVIVFAHHREVVALLKDGLREFSPVVIIGNTPAKIRQISVDNFQTDTLKRVFIGNEAAEEGITLTAAHDVILVEPEWVPGKNAQRADRAHRIGQTESVLIHYLVVEESLDAKILESAAHKSADIEGVLDK